MRQLFETQNANKKQFIQKIDLWKKLNLCYLENIYLWIQNYAALFILIFELIEVI